MTKLDYIFKVMENQGLKHYSIYDVKDNLVYNQMNDSWDTQRAQEEIGDFFKYNEGAFRVVLRNGPELDKAQSYTFNVSSTPTAEETAQKIQGIGNPMNPMSMGMPSGDQFFQLLMQREQELRESQNKSMMDLMEHIRKEHDLKMEIMKKEADLAAKGKEDNFSQMAMMGLSSLLGGGGMNVGVNGVGDEQPDTNSRITAAVRTLMKVDPKFVDNLEGLAKLALEKPQMYKMAVSQLNSI